MDVFLWIKGEADELSLTNLTKQAHLGEILHTRPAGDTASPAQETGNDHMNGVPNGKFYHTNK